ncbi:MAG: SpoIIE family protein phosphatase [Spirochaetota bacterium]
MIQLNYNSIGYIIATLLCLLMLLFFSRVHGKKQAGEYLILYVFSVFVFVLSNVITSSWNHPITAYGYYVTKIITLSAYFLMVFYFKYTGLYEKRLGRLLSYCYLSLVILAIFYCYQQVTPVKILYDFAHTEFIPQSAFFPNAVIGCLTLFGYLSLCLYALYKFQRERTRSRKVHLLFALSTFFPLLASSLAVLIYLKWVSTASFYILFISFIVMSVFLLGIAFSGYFQRAVSFGLKLIGIYIGASFITLYATGFIFFPLIEETFNKEKQLELLLIQKEIEYQTFQFPKSVAYIVSADKAKYDEEKLIYCGYDCLVDKIGIYHASLQQSRKKLNNERKYRYYKLEDFSSYSIYYQFSQQDRIYEVGFYYKDYRAYIHRNISKMLIGILIFIVCMLLVFPLLIRMILLAPLNNLLKGVMKANAGDLRIQVPIEYHDEVGYLAVSFNRLLNSIRRNIAEKTRLNVYKHDIEVSAEIVQKLLPFKYPHVTGLEFQVEYMPMREVGGDIYDFTSPGSRQVGVMLSDVTGHGLPAAMISGIVKMAFQIEEDNYHDPAKVLSKMNRKIYGNTGDTFVSSGYLYIDLDTMLLKYASSGLHPLIILDRQSQSIKKLHTDGLLLGVDPDSQYDTVFYQLRGQERILFYTDGIVEILHEKEELYDENTLETIIIENANKPLAAMFQEIQTIIRDKNSHYLSQYFYHDDITIIAIDISL